MGGVFNGIFGGGDSPEAPDYAGAAKRTAAGNLKYAKYATNANRIDQYTPYGSLTYDYKPQRNAAGKVTGRGWTQNVNLTPEAQKALDQQLALNTKYGQVANLGFDRVRDIFANPQLDTSQLPDRAIGVGQTAQDAIMSRLQPDLAKQEESLRARLANQGIGIGSDAYQRESDLAGRNRNDLEMQAALRGIALDQQNRSSALEEQAYLQDRPLNLINALRSGNQIQAPQFQQFAQQATTQGPDFSGAAQNQYNANLNSYNAQQAQQSGALGGLFSIGAGIAGLPMAGGGSVGGNYLGGLFGLGK